jgi:hypothetical protein
MKPSEHQRVQSPYVVVLGGNSVRRKSTPPPDMPHETHHGDPHKEEPKVYGVLQGDPSVKGMKTMSADLHIAEAVPKTPEVKPRLTWWQFGGGKSGLNKGTVSNPVQPSAPTLAPRAISHEVEHIRAPQRMVEIPSQVDHVQKTPYRGRFMRQIGKKWYLGSKLAIQLPFQAKVGIAVAILAVLVVPPLVSRLIPKAPPATAGAIVAMGTEALVAQVGKSISLPMGETPLVAVATADDIRRLNVTDSKPGNKILLYQKAGRIVVYDAEEDKVLGVVNRATP